MVPRLTVLLQSSANLFGVRLAGVSALTGRKLLLTLAFVVALYLVSYLLRFVLRILLRNLAEGRAQFWSRQAVQLVTVIVLVIGLVSIWFDDPSRLTTVAGLVTAGIAVALQRVITSFAAYFIILRGRVYTVGDRITMGGVRGDVVALGFMQTTVMEMGEPPSVQDSQSVWVHARQYTGRLVRLTNDRIFEAPVYNYTREFPYLWEEIHLPVSYRDDRARAEQILLDAARRHTAAYIEDARRALGDLAKRFTVPEKMEVDPRVYWRITDNWLELSLRFVVPERGIRAIKDAMHREIITKLDEAKIGIASGTYEIVGLPPIRIEDARRAPPS
jgi:small-conductance mechanosensitive channel